MIAGYSRLVIDCNRYIDDPAAFVHRTDGIKVTINIRMSEKKREKWAIAIFHPYHQTIAAILERFDTAGIGQAFLSIHTKNDRMRDGKRREQEVALCWALDPCFAQPVLQRMESVGAEAGENEPYSLEPGIDCTVPEHAMCCGLVNQQIKVR